MLLERYCLPLLKSNAHTKIIESIRLLIRKGLSPSSAIRRVLHKNKASFEDLFDTAVSDNENTGDEKKAKKNRPMKMTRTKNNYNYTSMRRVRHSLFVSLLKR